MTAALDRATTAGRWLAVAAERGDAPALVTPEASVSFAEAGERSAERARAVAAAVGEPGRPVAVPTESDVESAIAILAVLCSGRPLVVLDPFLPTERRDHILRLSGALELSPAQIAELPASGGAVPDPEPDQPAVIVFTSGSTGAPKGVVHGQRSWVNQARDGHDVLGFGPGDAAAVLLPLSFGAGLDALLMPLLNGAGVLLWDVRRRTAAGLHDWLSLHPATTLHCTPSLLRSWLGGPNAPGALPELRLATTCGEPVYDADVAALRATLLPADGVFCSWSGSSEAGNLAFNRFPPGRPLPAGPLPVGRPAADKVVRIVDADGAEVPPGVTGEVTVESAHLALRYHGDPERTAHRFRPAGEGRTVLRTGDLGRFDAHGELHLLGRRDDAVKIRGYLVEPIEVETAIRALPWTVDAAVTADAGRLIAHVAVDREKWSPSPAEIRTALGKTLAPWMIPRDVVVLAELPRTERGKIDRAALPAPAARDPEPVRGPTEATIGPLWCTVLGLDTVGRNEDFTELGGDSLAAATVIADLEHRFQVTLSTAMLAAAPTIAEFAPLLDAAIGDRSARSSGDDVVLLRSGEGPPIFLVAGAGSLATSLTPLARALSLDAPVYGVQAHGIESRARADRSIRVAARRVAARIGELAPTGPYRIAGHSWGGFVAVETAAALTRAGGRCESVVVLDSLVDPILAERLRGRRPGVAARWRAALRRGGRLPDRTGEAADDDRSRFGRWWNTLAMQVLMLTAGLVRLPATLQWMIFFDLGTRMIRRYRPSGYAGPVTLVRARTNPDDPGLWSAVTTGGVDVRGVAGDHHSIVRAPYVAETARILDETWGGRR
ncbi:AMP-binding protein [Gordonia sp. (in: high G+C Gram-positive bacteria)]|uniref:AMP-binding protein n=1 Tax=Gordonia sp. (in: high G+C Gram-positive bacteria) TaxID=84139 RepID=UPI00352926F8